MRAGPWMFLAGLTLLVAGVVSTRMDAWSARRPALTLPLMLEGIRTIDIRNSGIEKVVISSKGNAQLHYPAWPDHMRSNAGMKPASPACHATGDTLRCSINAQYLPGTPTMQLPSGRYRLLVRDAEIAVQSEIESFALEASGTVRWSGPVGALDVTLASLPRTDVDQPYCASPKFVFKAGRVHALRIHASTGSLDFVDMSAVEDIEVQAARDVGLSVKTATDITRIKLLAVPLVPHEDGSAVADAHDACASAVRVTGIDALD